MKVVSAQSVTGAFGEIFSFKPKRFHVITHNSGVNVTGVLEGNSYSVSFGGDPANPGSQLGGRAAMLELSELFKELAGYLEHKKE